MSNLTDIRTRIAGKNSLDVEEKIDLVVDVLDEVLVAVDIIMNNISPIVDTVTKSPFFKMLGVK